MTTFADDEISTTRSAWGFSEEPEPWRDDAICAQTDPEAFFPDKGGSTRDGKKICLGCPVRTECLQYALDHDERFGIWGGLSERERRRLRRGSDVTPAHLNSHKASDACYQTGCDSPQCREAHNAYERGLRRRKKGDAA
jgi:WhiB family redox-sensing transcriptional regulator